VAELFSQELRNYLDWLVPPRSAELAAMEAYGQANSFPIIGPAAGQCCYLLARVANARQIFELGSGYGYSTAWFARAVTENGGGTVHHVVWDQSLSDRAKRHLETLGYGKVVEFHVSEAVAALKQTPGAFDIVFNDIEKKDYPGSLPVIEDKLKPGGLLIVDNMLWSGRIFDDADQSAHTRGVREMTRLLATSDKWDATLLPIRDGLIVARKRQTTTASPRAPRRTAKDTKQSGANPSS
jgi:caffeoyl-CoA O-methyltransferase